MSVTYNSIYEKFHTQFKSKTVLSPELERAYLSNAISEFELELYELEISDIDEEIVNVLSNAETLLLAKLMYKSYLNQSRQEVNLKLNTYGKDIKQTGLDLTKRMLENSYVLLLSEIESMVHKIKYNTYLD